jgi:hypothetical protein
MQQRLDDLQLIRRAIGQRWPIPASRRGPLVRRLIEVAGNTKAVRNLVAAFRTLVDADRLNLAAEAQALDYLKKHQGQAPPESESLSNDERLHRINEILERARARCHGGENGRKS